MGEKNEYRVVMGRPGGRDKLEDTGVDGAVLLKIGLE
jgi:hypothetical protein